MIIIAQSYGQLGNRLFVHAHLMAAAIEYNVPLANPCFAEYASLFPATASDLWCRFPVVEPKAEANPPSARQRKWLASLLNIYSRYMPKLGLASFPYKVFRLKGKQACDLQSESFIQSVRSGRSVMCAGWLFRSEPLFEKHSDAIREYFQIFPKNQFNVDRLHQAIRTDAEVVIGVHIRHGDYATFMQGKYFYSVEQYASVMRSIESLYPGKAVAFLVCSNAKCSQEDFAGLNVHFGTGHIIEDMYALADCDLIVGPPSTYTGWASFYGETPIVVLESADQSIDLEPIQRSRRVA